MTIHALAGAWGSARVSELGGCVLGWAPQGRETLLAPAAGDLVEGQMWHGGIPVCAPWFGVGDGSWQPAMTHGLVSRVRWRTASLSCGDDGAQVVLHTSGADHTHLPGAERYPADLGYRLAVTCSASRLAVELTIVSPTRDATVDLALHPYWLACASNSRVEGLSGVSFRDAADSWRPGVQDGALPCHRPMDLVFSSAPPTRLVNRETTLSFRASGATDVVAWRPAGYPDGREFVCVEYGNVRERAVNIPAGGQHRICLHVEVGCTPTTGSEAR